MPFIGGGRSHTNRARERRKQQIPIPKAVSRGWQSLEEEYIGPTYFFTDGNCEKITYEDCLNKLDEINNNQKVAQSKASTLTGQKKLASKNDMGWLLMLFLWILKIFCCCFTKSDDNRKHRKTQIKPVTSKFSM